MSLADSSSGTWTELAAALGRNGSGRSVHAAHSSRASSMSSLEQTSSAPVASIATSSASRRGSPAADRLLLLSATTYVQHNIGF